MKYRATVTFENPQGAPEVVKSEIVAASHQKAASVAVREARKQLPSRRPSSIVVLLELDRDGV